MNQLRNMYLCKKCGHNHHSTSKIGMKHFAHNSNNETKLLPVCDICGGNLSNYCTTNVCELCCKSMKCPGRYKCAAYSRVLEKEIRNLRRNKKC